MDIRNWTRKVSKGYHWLIKALVWIGSISLAVIVLLVFVSVFARYLFKAPLQGAYEVTEETMAVVAGSAIMYTAVKRGHVSIDIVVRRFSKRTQRIMQRIFLLVGFGTWAVLAHRVFSMDTFWVNVVGTVGVGVIPFQPIVGLALSLCSLTLLIQAFQPMASGKTPEETVAKKEKQANEQ